MEQYSPKTSPRGARSPSVSGGMTPGGQMEGGNLKLSIALGQKPTIIQKGPFYLMKQEAIPASEVTGATNLMASKGLEHSYVKLTSNTWSRLFQKKRFQNDNETFYAMLQVRMLRLFWLMSQWKKKCCSK